MKSSFKNTSVRGALALATLIAMGLLPLAAHADGMPTVGVALTGGLSGFGGDLGVGINDYLGVRATAATFNINHNGQYGTSVAWDAKLKLMQAGVLLDVFPFAGGFRVSAGAVKDGNKFSLTGTPSGSGSYTFNGTSYPSTYVDSASASVDWSKTVPYVGVGWGNLSGSKGFHLTSDFGVLFTGSPTAQIAVACSAAGNSAGACSTLASDVAAEQAKLQNDVHKLTFWPVFRIGIGWAF